MIYRQRPVARLAQLAIALLVLGSAGCKRSQPEGGDKPAPEQPETAHAKAEKAVPTAEPAAPKKTPGAPFLWEVRSDAGTSYLFGTMHLGISAEDDVHPIVWEAFDKSEHVTIEIVSSELSFAQTQELLFLPEGKSLKTSLSAEQWKTLQANVKGFPQSQLDRISPLMASVLITTNWLPMQTPLDQVIESRARSGSKHVTGLEGFEETKGFTQNPAHVKYLAVMLDDIEEAKKELEQMHDAYLRGDAEAMLALVFSDENMSKFPELYEQLFYERNAKWIPKLEKRIREGNAFIAVGAGHLLGKKSVVDLLLAKGYGVKRLEIK